MYGISRVCRVLNCSRSLFYYKPKQKADKQIEMALQKKAEEHPSEGFWKAYRRLRPEGKGWNHKRVHKVYVKLGLPLRRKAKKRLPARIKEPLKVPGQLNECWSIDFTEDRLENGKKFRNFNVIDDANREILFVELDHTLPSRRVLWVLNHLINKRGKPNKIRMDNGPEFIAEMSKNWSKAYGIEFKYIQPGRPTQNAFVERFNGSFRRGVLNAYVFETINQVKEITAKWVDDYNNYRPHESLNNLPAKVFAKIHLSRNSRSNE